MPDTEQPEISRRSFLKVFGAGAAGAVAATVAPEIVRRNEQQERQEFYNTIKSITYEDLNNPESEKMALFVRNCASEYKRVTGLEEIDVDDLTSRTMLYGSNEEFYNSVKKAGDNSFTQEQSERTFGRTVFTNNTAHINLSLINKESNTYLVTEYPGVRIYKTLIHEWGDVLPVDNREGEHLRRDDNTIGDTEGRNQQVWERYRGGMIFSKDNYALDLFDNAWNELTTRRVLMESLKHDETLLSVATTLSSDSAYREASDKLSRVIERAGVDMKEMAKLHKNSDVERMFQRMGSVFEGSAVELLPEGTIRGRTSEQVQNDRDFLIGGRVAWMVTNKDWANYKGLIDHIKPRE